jgi:chemotaxis signal transduction protein
MELRRAFDRSFVEAKHYDEVASEDYLSIRVGGDPYVIRLNEIGGLFADKKVTGLPSRVAELAGVAGFRGAMVPVYDLAALLRYPTSQSARWMVIAAKAPVALAFDSFEGHFRFAQDAAASHGSANADGHIRQIVRADEFVSPVVNIPSVVAAIRKRTSAAGINKEQ